MDKTGERLTMTVEIKEEFTVKSKRKEHPNARKYPGRPSMEFGTGLRKFLGDLTSEEMKQFQEGSLVFEEEASAEFFDSVLPGDVVGLGLLRGLDGQPCAYQWKILAVDRDADTMQARNCTWEDEKKHPGYKGDERELTFEEFSCGLGMGFGEILERDGKPFGVSEEIEQKVVIYGEKEEKEENQTPITTTAKKEASVENPVTGQTGKVEAK